MIVTEAGGRERYYPGSAWAFVRDRSGQMLLEIERPDGHGEDEAIADYAPGAWLLVRGADAHGPDANTRALGHARKGLEDIAGLLRATPRGGLEAVDYATVLERIAAVVQGATEEIWLELEQ